MPDKPKGFIGDEWYNQGSDKSQKGGVPTTKQEESWILDYMGKYGHAPTPQEVNQGFTKNFNPMEAEYSEGSTMRDMGFKTREEYDRTLAAGEPYGPWSGKEIPEGSYIITKEERPWIRTYDPSRYRGALEKGELWQPGAPGYYNVENPNEPFKMEDLFPEYDRQKKNYTMEEVLGKYSQQDVYRARYEDYLNQKLETDTPEVQKWTNFYNTRKQQLEEQFILGQFGTSDDAKLKYNKELIGLKSFFDNKTANLLTKDKAAQLWDEADAMIGKGELENLPQYQELSGVMGGNKLMELYNNMLSGTPITDRYGNITGKTTGLEQSEKERLAVIPLTRSTQWWRENYYNKTEPAQTVEPTGHEQRDYIAFIDSLPVVAGYKDVMADQYYSLYSLWEAAGRPGPFMSWVRNYIAGGGK